MLSQLSYPFSVICLSETKFNSSHPVLNTYISGYHFHSQPSLSMAGGVGFYIKNDLSYTICSDLTISTKDFEAMWIEIASLGGSNVICGVIYRNPHGDLDSFVEYLNVGLERINQHNEIRYTLCLSSNFFQPRILQPTRITDHSATLIDNIFLNSLDHLVISGNIVYDLTDTCLTF